MFVRADILRITLLFIIVARLLWAFHVERTYEVVDGVKVEVNIDSLARNGQDLQ